MKLMNGVEMPNIGFGTWQIEPKDAKASCMMAVKHGYKMIDTAESYGNEEECVSGIDTKDVFIVTKLPAQYKTYDEAVAHFNESLKKLGRIDLYLIHAPWPWNEQGKDCMEGNIMVWKAFCDLYKAGKVGAIGVSNFHPDEMDMLYKATGVMPMVNQIRYFIGNRQIDTYNYCIKNNIAIMAYSPLATSELLESEEVKKMAVKYNKTPAQICIRYCIDTNTIPVVKSTKEERIKANLDVDFKLDDEDIKYLNSLKPQASTRPYRS
jgi:diketogulonate reductase-like aldo/keto reductase